MEPKHSINKKLMSTAEMARFLGVSRSRAYELMHCKGFPRVVIGKRFYINEESLLKWLKGMEGKELRF